jgi:hypothetical protein
MSCEPISGEEPDSGTDDGTVGLRGALSARTYLKIA